jgi:hypothetical protein
MNKRKLLADCMRRLNGAGVTYDSVASGACAYDCVWDC